ncbi:MAG: polysaccharide deacetylase family protein, partial [Clostridia bacterium]|nr:polysaccharide deacetylase family protein [Clostridia bacterium]
MRDVLTNDYGCVYQIFVRPTYGSNPEMLMNAAKACNLQVMTQLKEAVPDTISRVNYVSEALDVVVKPNEGKYQRGEIIHFQLDLIQHNDYLVSQLVENLIVLECVYPVMTADAVAADTARLYTYPLPDSAILPEVRDKIYPGHLAGYTNEQIVDAISKGYIGIDWVNTSHFLPGFAPAEIRKLDKRGLIANDQNYVFLTFDDWGTDENIDRLLEVLRKHNVKATFFVRTQYVPNNPNLLRAIA